MSYDSGTPYLYPAGDTVVSGTLLPSLTDGMDMLPYDHSAYFDLSKPHVLIRVEHLVASRARPQGIANANDVMRQAALGLTSRRAPISTERMDDRWTMVLDGNSTFLNALYSGWPDIPCSIADSRSDADRT